MAILGHHSSLCSAQMLFHCKFPDLHTSGRACCLVSVYVALGCALWLFSLCFASIRYLLVQPIIKLPQPTWSTDRLDWKGRRAAACWQQLEIFTYGKQELGTYVVCVVLADLIIRTFRTSQYLHSLCRYYKTEIKQKETWSKCHLGQITKTQNL